jgi:site-specific recombinase XerD
MIWFKSFRRFVGQKSPEDLEGRDLQDFLSHLAVEKRIAPSTQNQALNAVLFFFRHVLGKNVDQELSAVRAKHRRHLPVVLSQPSG